MNRLLFHKTEGHRNLNAFEAGTRTFLMENYDMKHLFHNIVSARNLVLYCLSEGTWNESGMIWEPHGPAHRAILSEAVRNDEAQTWFVYFLQAETGARS